MVSIQKEHGDKKEKKKTNDNDVDDDEFEIIRQNTQW